MTSRSGQRGGWPARRSCTGLRFAAGAAVDREGRAAGAAERDAAARNCPPASAAAGDGPAALAAVPAQAAGAGGKRAGPTKTDAAAGPGRRAARPGRGAAGRVSAIATGIAAEIDLHPGTARRVLLGHVRELQVRRCRVSARAVLFLLILALWPASAYLRAKHGPRQPAAPAPRPRDAAAGPAAAAPGPRARDAGRALAALGPARRVPQVAAGRARR